MLVGSGIGTPFAGPTLYDNMTPPPAHSSEPVFFQNPAGIFARENPKSSHAWLRIASRRLRCADVAYGFLQVGGGLLYRSPLARHIELGAQRNIQVAFFFNNRRIAALRHKRVSLLLQIERHDHRSHGPLRLLLKLGHVITVDPKFLAVDNQVAVLLHLLETLEPLHV